MAVFGWINQNMAMEGAVCYLQVTYYNKNLSGIYVVTTFELN